jgi:integrase
MTDPTIGVYFRYLKAIYNYSVEMKYVIKEQNPFKNFIIQNARNNKRALSKTTIQSLKDYKAECKNEEMARDFFIFSYLSNGMNFKDICLLKFNDIDKEIISFRRHKTINTAANIIKIQFLITEMHTSIIEKWGNIMTSEQNEDYLFPILNNCTNEIEIQQKIDQFIKRTNKYLARISKNIGLGFSISTIYARHSFATKLKNENIGQPIIKELMGHQDPNTTSSYFSEIGIENLRSIAALIALD